MGVRWEKGCELKLWGSRPNPFPLKLCARVDRGLQEERTWGLHLPVSRGHVRVSSAGRCWRDGASYFREERLSRLGDGTRLLSDSGLERKGMETRPVPSPPLPTAT